MTGVMISKQCINKEDGFGHVGSFNGRVFLFAGHVIERHVL